MRNRCERNRKQRHVDKLMEEKENMKIFSKYEKLKYQILFIITE